MCTKISQVIDKPVKHAIMVHERLNDNYQQRNDEKPLLSLFIIKNICELMCQKMHIKT